MADHHPAFEQPADPDVRIWRYLSLPKLLSLLQTKSLFLARAEVLDDPFEGSTPRPEVSALAAAVNTAETEEEKAAARENLRKISGFRRLFLTKYCVNCWHMNSGESAAMWKVYDAAVAIRSTYQALRDVLPPDIFLGCVRYIDYERDRFPSMNVVHGIMHKRSSFSHEREIRAVYVESMLPEGMIQPPEGCTLDERGLTVPIALERLIHGIYVNPSESSWFRETIQRVVLDSGLRVDLEASSLSERPIY